MKRLIFLSICLFSMLALSAQNEDEGLKVDNSSFKNIKTTATVDDSMGGMHMLAENIDWGNDDYCDGDGDDRVALLLVKVENMVPEEVEKLTAIVSNGNGRLLPPKTTDQGYVVMRVIVPARESKIENKTKDITFTHPVYGSARLANKSFTSHNVYTVTLVNSKRVNVFIDSKPQGAYVFFDSKNVGKTPCEVKDVSMNQHTIELRAADNSYNSLPREIVNISESNNRFNYDLRKSKTVTFKTDTKGAFMQLVDPADGNKTVAEGFGGFTAKDIPYGGYTIVSKINGQPVEPISITVNGSTPETYNVKVQESKAITIIAYQNNNEVKGAQVDLEGKQIGTTPLSYNMPYGRHRVNVSYFGQSKSQTINVDKNSAGEYKIILPNRFTTRSRWNPFNIDYKKREFSFDFGYVQKYYVYKVSEGGRSYSINCNNWGEEKKQMHGFQVGIGYRPYFGYGQGLVTGIYWQMYIGKAELFDDSPAEHEHDLYIPLLYQFRLPLGENFSIYACAGIAAEIGLAHSLRYGEDDYYESESYNIGFGYNDTYELYMPNRCQFLVPVGGGIQYRALQFEFKYSWGLTDNKETYIADDEFKQSFKARMIEATLSIAF